MSKVKCEGACVRCLPQKEIQVEIRVANDRRRIQDKITLPRPQLSFSTDEWRQTTAAVSTINPTDNGVRDGGMNADADRRQNS